MPGCLGKKSCSRVGFLAGSDLCYVACQKFLRYWVWAMAVCWNSVYSFQFLSLFFSFPPNIDTAAAVFTVSELTTGTWFSLRKVADSREETPEMSPSSGSGYCCRWEFLKSLCHFVYSAFGWRSKSWEENWACALVCRASCCHLLVCAFYFACV